MAKERDDSQSKRGDNPPELCGQNIKRMPLQMDAKENLDAGHPDDKEQSKRFDQITMFDPIIYILDLKGELKDWTQDSGKRMIPKTWKKYIGEEEKISNEQEMYDGDLTGDKIGALVVQGPTEAICVIFGKEADELRLILSKIMKMIPFTDAYSHPTVQKDVSIQSFLKKIIPGLYLKYVGDDLNRILMEDGDVQGLHGYEFPQADRTANISHEQNLLKFSGSRPKLDNVLQGVESSGEVKNVLFSESREDDNGIKKNFVDSLENSDVNMYQTAGEDDLAFYYDNEGHCNTMRLSRSGSGFDESVEITHLTIHSKSSKHSSDCLLKVKSLGDGQADFGRILHNPWESPRMKIKERYEGNAIDKQNSELSNPHLQKEVEEGDHAFEALWSNNNPIMRVGDKLTSALNRFQPRCSPSPARHIPTQSVHDEQAMLLSPDKMSDPIAEVSETHTSTETDVLALSQPLPVEDAKENEQTIEEDQTSNTDQHHELVEPITVPQSDASVQETRQDSEEHARHFHTLSSEETDSQNAPECSADNSEKATKKLEEMQQASPKQSPCSDRSSGYRRPVSVSEQSLDSAVETDCSYVPHKTETETSDSSSPLVSSERETLARRTDFPAPVQVSSPDQENLHTAWPECRSHCEEDTSTSVHFYPSRGHFHENERITRQEEMNTQQSTGACGGSASFRAREEETYVGYRSHQDFCITEENHYSIEMGNHHHDCQCHSIRMPCQETVSPQARSVWQPQSLQSAATLSPHSLQSTATPSPHSLPSATPSSPHSLPSAATPSPQSLQSSAAPFSSQASASSTNSTLPGSLSLPYPLQSDSASPPSPLASRPQLPPIIVHSAAAIPPWATKKARINLSLATNREYVRLNTRRATYGDDWPSDCAIDGANMALCGFFNLGADQGVRCFFCGLELRHLTREHNIWDEHVRHRPDCHYLVAIMGPDFLAKTQRCLQEKEKK